ncbi:hypothetical protein [Thioalbus denitrificans]|uniref:Uncharacterized protein n=1 Tax=Thioalbus denitrificans TaxID=547122 RepID=A0A369CDG0_9GAMM|nr:hypothetical protein [Thioalbus denitrificans]RCX32072.1 hypothetical protein DFQ59_102425 [Thioalbus denitrificans]
MSLQRTKLSTAVRKAAGEASSDQLEAINRLALAELAAEQVYVRTAYLGHNGIDRDREVLDDGLLDDFARTLPGKGLHLRHPGGWNGDSGPGIGRWFEARVVEMSLDEARAALREPGLQFPPGTERAKLLEASSYLPRSGKNADLILDIDAGVAGDQSLGFTASDRTAIQNPAGDTIAYRLLGPGEALEASLVWLGAQPGARFHKGAPRPTAEDHEMSEEQMKALQKKADDAEARAKALQPKADGFDAIAKAVGDGLAADPDALKAAVSAGQAAHDELVNDIVSSERLAGMVTGDDEASTKNAKALYADWSMDRLKAYAERVKKLVPAGGTIAGGDPNATAAGGGPRPKQDGQKSAFNPTENPLVTG